MNDIDAIRSELEIDTRHRDIEIEELKKSLNFAYKEIDDLKKEKCTLTALYHELKGEIATIKSNCIEIKKASLAN